MSDSAPKTWDDLPVGTTLISKSGNTFHVKMDMVSLHLCANHQDGVDIKESEGMHGSGAYSWSGERTFIPVDFLL